MRISSNCLLIVAVLVAFGFAASKLVEALIAAHQYLIDPTYRFVLLYFEQYCRATAEVVCVLGIAVLGPRFHRQVVSEITQAFADTIQRVETERNELSEELQKEASQVKGLIREREGVAWKLSNLRGQKEKLEAKAEELQLEIERLKEPDKVAEREEDAKAEATEELLEHVDQTRWRSLG